MAEGRKMMKRKETEELRVTKERKAVKEGGWRP
jgi:hypothetical protein